MSEPSKFHIAGLAREFGFDLVAFARPQSCPEWLESLKAYPQTDMEYLKNNIEIRADPQKIWEPVKTIVVLAVSFYNLPQPKSDPDKGVFSIYAYGLDYHDYIKKMLKKLARRLDKEYQCQSRVYCDTAPVMEKQIAKLSGLGWQAKNSLIASRQLGNCFFLAEVFLDIEIPEVMPQEQSDCCGKCQRCQQACPTKALSDGYRLNPLKCLSYWTIEHKGLIPEEIMSKMGNKIYGCDDCVLACPWNKFAKVNCKEFFKPRDYLNKDLSFFLGLEENTFRELFAKSAVKRIGWTRFMRNVIIAAGNSKNPQYLTLLQKFLKHQEPIISQTAAWACARLNQ